MKPTVLWCAAVLVATSQIGAKAESRAPVAGEWGKAVAGLRLAITSATTPAEPVEVPVFQIMIENVGDNDVVVNLGMMLANGKAMLPEAVRLLLTDSEGVTRELRYFDRRYGVIAGRVDDFIVSLRAGSTYTIRAPLDQYWSPSSKEFGLKLGRGQYRIEALFNGQGAQHPNLDTPGVALLNFWKGTLRSNVLEFEMR